MTTITRFVAALGVMLILAGGMSFRRAIAHEALAQQQPAAPPLVPVKVDVILSRFQGEKKVSSIPYALTVNADESASKLRMGVQVPITTQSKDGISVQYRDVGNNIDCNARTADEGRFRLGCTFEQSSLYSTEAERKVGGDGPPQYMPMIRNFRSEASLTLRDGQTVQHTLATDPVSGEVIKIEVTLNVVR